MKTVRVQVFGPPGPPMHVVRHDNPGNQIVTFPCETPPSIHHAISRPRILRYTTAVARIKPGFQPLTTVGLLSTWIYLAQFLFHSGQGVSRQAVDERSTNLTATVPRFPTKELFLTF